MCKFSYCHYRHNFLQWKWMVSRLFVCWTALSNGNFRVVHWAAASGLICIFCLPFNTCWPSESFRRSNRQTDSDVYICEFFFSMKSRTVFALPILFSRFEGEWNELRYTIASHRIIINRVYDAKYNRIFIQCRVTRSHTKRRKKEMEIERERNRCETKRNEITSMS